LLNSWPLISGRSNAPAEHSYFVNADFFGTPRGLGQATAMTSAVFLPHLEQRIRRASSLSVIFQPTRRASACG
jgi:hypothetical protein